MGVDCKDERGLTPLHRAAALGDRDTVCRLLAGGADPAVLDSRMGASALHHAAQSGSIDVARLLLDAGAFLNLQVPTHGVTPLMAAVWYRRPDLVAFLLRQREINVELRSVFGVTAVELIGFGADPDDGGAERQNAELHRIFADHRRLRDEQLAAQLLFVALTGPAEERTARVRRLTDDGDESVHAVSPVMSSGSDGQTPLLIAARDGDIDAVAALVAAGADQTVADHYMHAVAAHKAAYGGHADVLRLLAGAPGFDSIKDAQGPYNGYTPLHDAAWHGHVDAAEVLLAAGVREDLVGLDGRTPLDLAREHGYDDLAALLTRPAGRAGPRPAAGPR